MGDGAFNREIPGDNRPKPRLTIGAISRNKPGGVRPFEKRNKTVVFNLNGEKQIGRVKDVNEGKGGQAKLLVGFQKKRGVEDTAWVADRKAKVTDGSIPENLIRRGRKAK